MRSYGPTMKEVYLFCGFANNLKIREGKKGKVTRIHIFKRGPEDSQRLRKIDNKRGTFPLNLIKSMTGKGGKIDHDLINLIVSRHF